MDYSARKLRGSLARETKDFEQLWERVGSPSQASGNTMLFQTEALTSPYCGLMSSQRLMEVSRRRPAVNTGPLKRTEAGSALRYLKPSLLSASTPSLPSRINEVSRGLEELRARPTPLRRSALTPKLERGSSSFLQEYTVLGQPAQSAEVAVLDKTSSDIQAVQQQSPKAMSAVEIDLGAEVAAAAPTTSSSLSKASMLEEREKLLKILDEEDPVVSQFLRFLCSTFHTLRMAYRFMDTNGNGSLTKSEFTDCLPKMRSKEGLRILDAHYNDLFERVQSHRGGGNGPVTPAELGAALQSGDRILERLGRFLARAPLLEEAFQKKADGERITREEFKKTLELLQYDDWHASELFNRLDRDGSGNLSIGEFTACLVRDAALGHRLCKPEAKGPPKPLGSEERQKEVLDGYTGLTKSRKLSGSTRPGAHDDDALLSQMSWRQRPDHLQTVREGLKSVSKRSSQSTMSGELPLMHLWCSQARTPDLVTGPSIGLEDFKVSASRCRVGDR